MICSLVDNKINGIKEKIQVQKGPELLSMNPFFVCLLILIIAYRYFSFPNVVSIVLNFFKYTRMGLALMMPPKKGSVEYLRGGILKIAYLDPNQNDATGKVSDHDKYAFLTYSIPAKHWNKVLMVTDRSLATYQQKLEEQSRQEEEDRKAIEIALRNSPSVEKLENDHDIASDLSDIAGVEVDVSSLASPPSRDQEVQQSITSRKKNDAMTKLDELAIRQQVRECEKEDVTELVLLMAGPGKDFFGVSIKACHLVPHAAALIFLFGKKSKTFLSSDVISL